MASYNSADAQIQKALGGAPSVERVKSYMGAQKQAPSQTAGPSVVYKSANDQVKSLFGTDQPSKEQIQGLVTQQKEETSVPDSGSNDDLLKELDRLESEYSSISQSIQQISSGVVEADKSLRSLEKQYKLPTPKPSKPIVVQAVAGSGAKPATSSASSAQAAVLVPAGGGAKSLFDGVKPIKGGVLAIAGDDKITTALKFFLEKAFGDGLKFVEKKGPVSTLKDGSITYEGASAIFARLVPGLMGSTPVEKALVQQWCGFSTSEEIATVPSVGAMSRTKLKAFESVNTQLEARSYLTGFTITLADLFLWAVVAPWLRNSMGTLREHNPNVTRWFQYVQHTDGLCLPKSRLQISANALNLPHQI